LIDNDLIRQSVLFPQKGQRILNFALVFLRAVPMARTAVNVYGDTCVAVVVAKSEGERLPIDI
jgi:Na+/H+-dicarboxylate symporter